MHTQEEAIKAIKSGYNVFISGAGGVGKSYVINTAINKNTTIIAAPTGIAALNVDGVTCHSLFKLPVGLATESENFMISDKMRKTFGLSSRITSIVIDEVSMLRADYFDQINRKLQRIRETDEPFGGLQIIIVGDLFQLPPIIGKDEKKHFRRQGYKSPWVFDAKCFEECNFKNIILEKIYRQDNKEQIEVLNQIRKGINLEYCVSKINEWANSEGSKDRLSLCTYNKDADRINKEEFEKSKNLQVKYSADVEGDFKVSDCIVPKKLFLKDGLRVIICSNDIGEGLYKNGEMGTIIKCYPDYLHVEKDSGEEVYVRNNTWESFSYGIGLKGELKKKVKGSMTQIPAKMGYGISVHKSQGMTLDNIYINFGYSVKNSGLVYVALSRARDLKKIHLARPLREEDIIVDRHVKQYYSTIEDICE